MRGRGRSGRLHRGRAGEARQRRVGDREATSNPLERGETALVYDRSANRFDFRTTDRLSVPRGRGTRERERGTRGARGHGIEDEVPGGGVARPSLAVVPCIIRPGRGTPSSPPRGRLLSTTVFRSVSFLLACPLLWPLEPYRIVLPRIPTYPL